MEVQVSFKKEVNVKRIKTCIKVCDRFTADVLDETGNTVRSIKDELFLTYFQDSTMEIIWSLISILRPGKSLTGKSQLLSS